MDYAIELKEVASRRLAVVRVEADMDDLAEAIPRLLDEVWPVLRSARVLTGSNVVVYDFNATGFEVGVEVFGPVPATGGRVTSSETPGGLTATTTHWGGYAGLPEAFEAVRDWCTANKLEIAGPAWEVYGHWDEDATRLRTDVFFLLRRESAG